MMLGLGSCQTDAAAPKVELGPNPLGMKSEWEENRDAAEKAPVKSTSADVPLQSSPQPAKAAPTPAPQQPSPASAFPSRDEEPTRATFAVTEMTVAPAAMASGGVFTGSSVTGGEAIVPRPGSENPAPGAYAWFDLVGVSPSQLSATILRYYPRDGVFVMDGQTWAGQPFILFSAKNAGKYLLEAIIHSPDSNTIVEYEVVVGDGPTPPPPPPPPPLTGLSKKVYDWAYSEVPAADRHLAAALAVSFNTLASRISSGTLTDPEEIITKTVEANRLAIGDEGRAAWLSWFNVLKAYLNAESDAGRLITPAQHAAAWQEIAKGLAAVE